MDKFKTYVLADEEGNITSVYWSNAIGEDVKYNYVFDVDIDVFDLLENYKVDNGELVKR